MCGCLPACLYTLHTHAPPEARRGHWSFWSRIYSCECHVADGNQKRVLLTAAPFLRPQPRCFLWMLFICFVLIFKRTCQPSVGNGESSIRLKRLDSLGWQIWGNLGLQMCVGVSWLTDVGGSWLTDVETPVKDQFFHFWGFTTRQQIMAGTHQ